MSPRKRDRKPARELSPEQAAAVAMVAEAKARGQALTGPDGLLKLFALGYQPRSAGFPVPPMWILLLFPGGAAKLGAVGVDAPLVAGLPPQRRGGAAGAAAPAR